MNQMATISYSKAKDSCMVGGQKNPNKPGKECGRRCQREKIQGQQHQESVQRNACLCVCGLTNWWVALPSQRVFD